jgi:hypothetical protein
LSANSNDSQIESAAAPAISWGTVMVGIAFMVGGGLPRDDRQFLIC